MVDIPELMEKARSKCQEFYQHQLPISTKISWQPEKVNINSNDPFQRVELKDNRVVLNYTVTGDNIGYIDMLKGLLAYHSPHIKQDTWSSWNFFTMTALLLTPTSLVGDGKKSTYASQWVEIQKNLVNMKIEHNYFRWYRILSSYQRVFVEQLLQQFVTTFYNPDRNETVEIQFNMFLLRQDLKYISKNDIDILSYCLSEQNIDVKDLVKSDLDIQQTSVYRILQRLSLQLGEYFVPKYLSLGLSNILIGLPDHTAKQLRAFKKHPYYQNIENFSNKPEIMVKFLIPSSQRSSITQLFSNLNDQIVLFERFRHTRIILNRLDLYSFDTETWQDHGSSSEIKITKYQQHQNVSFNHKEMVVLRDIVQTRTESHTKLSTRFSRSVTRKTIRNLQEKDLYYKQVLWRSPAKFKHYTAIISISRNNNVKLVKNKPSSILEIEWDMIEFERMIRQELNKLEIQIPSVTAELGLNLGKSKLNQDKIKTDDLEVIVVLRLAGPKESIEKVKSTFSDADYQGTLKWATGDMLNIPSDNYRDKEGWQFDLEEISEIFMEKVDA